MNVFFHLWIIVDADGYPIGAPHLAKERAEKQLQDAAEEAPDRAPFRVQEYRAS